MEKTKVEDGLAYPPSAYAYVPDEDRPSTWKLRVSEYGDGRLTLTRAQVARAAQALGPGGFRGNRVKLPRDAIAGVKRKLRALYRELGVKDDEGPAHLKESGLNLPIKSMGAGLSPAGHFIEARAEGKVWDVVIIRAGRSDNGRLYPRHVLERAASLFEGAKAFVFGRIQDCSPATHLPGAETVIYDHLSEEELKANPKGFVKNLVGFYRNPRLDGDDLKAELHILDSEKWLVDKLRSAWEQGNGNGVGLSIDAKGVEEGGVVKEMVSVDSVDLVTYPAAGGRFERLVASGSAAWPSASNGGNRMEWNELVDVLKKISDEELQNFLAEYPDLGKRMIAIIKPDPSGNSGAGSSPATHLPGQQGIEPPAGNLPAALGESVKQWLKEQHRKLEESQAKLIDLEKKLRERECRAMLRERLAAPNLPEPVAAKFQAQWDGRIFEASELDRAIETERAALARLAESQGLKWTFGKTKAEVMADESDKLFRRLDGFFANEDIDGVPRFKSFKEAYIAITGDEKVTGYVTRRMKESLATTTWAEILGDSITRRMVAEYNAPALQEWRRIVSDMVPISDFRTQRRMRMGGYGTLPTVAQSQAYSALATPTDEEATYSPSKRGGTETVTLEAIKNDDVGAIRRIPQRLGRAAAQTLYRFVFDFLANNSTIYDNTALFTSGHGNLGSTALSYTALNTALTAMADQAAYGDTSEVLGLKPRYLLVPNELRETAWQLIYTTTKPGTANRDDNMFAIMGMDLIVVPYWTDANDWYLVADPRDVPTIEIGFMDGQEEPEVFVQDMPNVGSMFNNDQLTYKVRHIYGGAVLDFRGFYGALVA